MEVSLSIEEQTLLAAQELLARRTARDTLLGFIQYTYTGFVAKPHHLLVISYLEKVMRGEIKKLMLFLPPRHGKSLIASRRFPAYYLGKNPNKQVMMVSYQERLAKTFGRDVRNVMYSNKYRTLFPDVKISADAKAAGQWNTTKEGGFLSAGIGAGRGTGVTGFGADALILDDLLKGRKDADSATIREDIQNSLQSDVFTRVHQPHGAIIYIGTRWHTDDPAGHILANDNQGEWTIVSLPALAEKNDPLSRKEGEALWPERYSREYLLGLRDNPAKLGLKQFTSLYQQQPVQAEGNLFKADSFKRWNQATLPPQFDLECITMDTNVSEGADNDFTVIQHWGKSGSFFYLLDQVRGNWNMTQQLTNFRIFCDTRPWVAAKLVEKASNGAAILDLLARWVPGLIPITPIGSKEQRALAIEPYVSAGNVYLPETKDCAWVEDFLLECSQFPHGKHDDQIDAATQALNWLAKAGAQMLDYTAGMLHAFGGGN